MTQSNSSEQPEREHSRPERVRSHRRGAAVRDGVMSAAVNELLNVGFDGLTIAQVADRAGVHVTSVYRRWKTKEQLITDALINHLDPSIPAPDTGSLRGDLIAMCTDLNLSLTSPQMKALLRLSVMPVEIDPLGDARRRIIDARTAALKTVFGRAIERGEISAADQPDYSIAVEVIHAPIYARVLLNREPVTGDFVASMVDMLLTGLGERPPAD